VNGVQDVAIPVLGGKTMPMKSSKSEKHKKKTRKEQTKESKAGTMLMFLFNVERFTPQNTPFSFYLFVNIETNTVQGITSRSAAGKQETSFGSYVSSSPLCLYKP
jgi:hypothetical protein